jgi:biopolymer transport protein ExbB/TolQ
MHSSSVGIDLTDVGPVAIGVIVVLLMMSVLSLAVMVERFWVFRLARRQSRRIVLEVGRLLAAGHPDQALKATQSPEVKYSHLARTLAAGLAEWKARMLGETPEDRDLAVLATKEAMHQATAIHLAELRRGLPLLATVGSTAPFVGLFGTTFGIIDAFRAISLTGAGGIGAVSAGIAEALVTTAFGLLVAVPAVWGYNYFAGALERFTVEADRGGYDLAVFLSKPRS